MIVLDTDTVTLLEHGHERTTERLRRTTEPVATTLITRIEILSGRFASVLKAKDGTQLLLAQHRLEQAESRLQSIPILLIDPDAAAEFDRLRQNKKLKKIGLSDLLIAAITLAQGATLVTRNLKHFRQVSGLQVENWAD
jgi:tRNA(fMet)-specific endonuclease VapC